MCEYLGRNIGVSADVGYADAVASWRSAIEQASEYMLEHFGSDGDALAVLPYYQARFELVRLQSPDAARAVYQVLLWHGDSVRIFCLSVFLLV